MKVRCNIIRLPQSELSVRLLESRLIIGVAARSSGREFLQLLRQNSQECKLVWISALEVIQIAWTGEKDLPVISFPMLQ